MNRIITEAATETSAWRDTTLGEFVRLQRGHDLTDDDRRPGKVPVMGAAGMNGYHDTVMAKGPGVVIGRSGASFGKAHYCPEDYWPHNTGLYVTDFQGNDPRFTYYFLKSLDFSGYNSGSAQPSLNRNFIYRIPVCVPEPSEQRAIAGVLGALDDKIELNRRMNETLEALAQTLFQRMMDDSGDESTVDEEFNLTMGQSPPGETYNETGDGIAFFQGRTDFGFRYPTARVFCTAPTRFANAGDALVSVRAPVGSVNMAEDRCCVGRGVAAVRHKSGSRSYTYYFMRSLESEFASFEAEGTVFGSVSKADFHKIKCLAPRDHRGRQPRCHDAGQHGHLTVVRERPGWYRGRTRGQKT